MGGTQPIRVDVVGPESLDQQTTIGLQPFPAVTPIRGEHHLRCQQAGFNRWTNSLSALRIGDSGGVSDQQHAIAGNLPRSPAVQGIRVTHESRRNVQRKPAGRPQIPEKLGGVAGKAVQVHPAEPYVQHVLLAEAPAVALQIGAEIKLRYFCADGASS